MCGHKAPGVGIVRAAATLLAIACSSPTDPFTAGPAHASVTGVVTAHDGTPVSRATLRIDCAGGGSALVILTDSTGHYGANVETGSDPFDGTSGQLLCHFTEPAAAHARVQLDTMLGFVRGPVLVALQFVDLHEP